ncbi:alpha/beta hydrolase [bacterium]|nr:MAG: alpha/beta hydrolase [bacterium]
MWSASPILSSNSGWPMLEIMPYLLPRGLRRKPGVLVLPGGGYGGHAGHEGEPYAKFLNELGFHAWVLKYKLDRWPVPFDDAVEALAQIRENSLVDPKRVGVMGSSAGGHLAGCLATMADPAFAILCYPVILMGEPEGHAGSQKNLCGDDLELAKSLCLDKRVTKDTCPCFLWHTREDEAVPVANSIRFAAALEAHGIEHELHVFEKGRHGIGLANNHPWTFCLENWLRGL